MARIRGNKWRSDMVRLPCVNWDNMATAELQTMTQPRRRYWRRVLLLVALAAALVLAWFWKPLSNTALAGASFGARTACSCHYIAGRSLSDCRKDFEPGMGLIMLSTQAKEKSLTARFPLLASQTATFREGEGCVLERWED
jgi:hypothetical protein